MNNEDGGREIIQEFHLNMKLSLTGTYTHVYLVHEMDWVPCAKSSAIIIVFMPILVSK